MYLSIYLRISSMCKIIYFLILIKFLIISNAIHLFRIFFFFLSSICFTIDKTLTDTFFGNLPKNLA